MNQTEKGRHSRTLSSTLIEPFKQIKLGIYVMVLSLTFVAGVGYLIVSAFIEQYQQVMEIFSVVGDSRLELIQNEVFKSNIIKISVAMGFYIVLLFWTVFWITHKYYGPIVSINRFVDGLTEGDYSQRVTIRKGDELAGLVSKLNLLANALEERHGAGDRERRKPNRGRRDSDGASTSGIHSKSS